MKVRVGCEREEELGNGLTKKMAVPIPMTGIIAIIMQIVEIVLAGYTVQNSLGLLGGLPGTIYPR
jgi:hypothetical protein